MTLYLWGKSEVSPHLRQQRPLVTIQSIQVVVRRPNTDLPSYGDDRRGHHLAPRGVRPLGGDRGTLGAWERRHATVGRSVAELGPDRRRDGRR